MSQWMGPPILPDVPKSPASWQPTWKVWVGVVALALVIVYLWNTGFFSGSTTPSVAEPSYVKDVVAYEEGTDAMYVYFVLADASGTEVRAQGRAKLNVYEEGRKLWTTNYSVTTSAFQKGTVGVGGFAHTRLICSLGRIEYSRFTTRPTESYGKVEIIFTTQSGKTLRGETSYFF
ncbi:MAG: hypothetical protein NTX23_08365 [Candidatus Bipolaricaulota bacterium]|nr:hypothetical protein [Candidatus Bipolaricaulota bacterium]